MPLYVFEARVFWNLLETKEPCNLRSHSPHAHESGRRVRNIWDLGVRTPLGLSQKQKFNRVRKKLDIGVYLKDRKCLADLLQDVVEERTTRRNTRIRTRQRMM